MGRKNRPPANRTPQHSRGKARPQGAHKKARSEGVARAVRDLEGTPLWQVDAA